MKKFKLGDKQAFLVRSKNIETGQEYNSIFYSTSPKGVREQLRKLDKEQSIETGGSHDKTILIKPITQSDIVALRRKDPELYE